MDDQLLRCLEENLALAYSRKAALEREIQTLAPTGMQSLPAELLSEIFEITLASSNMTLRDIRLVCPLWNQVGLQTSRLSGYIRLTIPFTLEEIKRCTQFCAESLDRSGEHPLTISLDYCSFPDNWQILKERTKHIPDLDHPESVQTWITDRILYPEYNLFQTDMYRLSNGISSFTAMFERDGLSWLEPLSTLVGRGQQHMSRWRSFEFIFPQALDERIDLLFTIFPQGIRLYPSLEIFKLRCIYQRPDAPGWGFFERPSSIVAELGQNRLEEFSIHNIELSPIVFDISSLNPSSLCRLTLRNCTIHSFRFIVQCRNLEYLSIRNIQDFDPSLITDNWPVTLTRLSTLQCAHIQYHPGCLFRLISVPILQKLIIHIDYSGFSTRVHPYPSETCFPSLEQLDIRWVTSWRRAALKMTLRFILANAPILDTVTIDKRELHLSLLLMKEISDEGIEPKSLRTLLLADGRVDEPGDRQIVSSLGFADVSSFISYCHMSSVSE